MYQGQCEHYYVGRYNVDPVVVAWLAAHPQIHRRNLQGRLRDGGRSEAGHPVLVVPH